MQAGFHAWAYIGAAQEAGGWGGVKRTGGDWAKGMPRNLLTTTGVARGVTVGKPMAVGRPMVVDRLMAAGRLVVVPMMTPELMVAVAASVEANAAPGC